MNRAIRTVKCDIPNGTLVTSLRGCFSNGVPPPASTEEESSASLTRNTRYRRRTSDPQTLREIGDFRRDLLYSKRRPMPTLPWLQGKRRTYMDDAERLYGRKETWPYVSDSAVREKLLLILRDYVRDTLDAADLEARDARKYNRKCRKLADEYRSFVFAGAWSSSEALRSWVTLHSKGNAVDGDEDHDESIADSRNERGYAKVDSMTSPHDYEGESGQGHQEMDELRAQSHTSKEEERNRQLKENRRRRGEAAILEDTAATQDLLGGERHTASFSAFPFLRQRALDNEESLDPSLVDWTAKYFPDDDSKTFARPPQLRNAGGGELDAIGSSNENNASENDARGAGSSIEKSMADTYKSRPRHRLQSSLRAHEDRHRATFDAEGVFYHVRRPSDSDEQAPKPKPVRGSDSGLNSGQRDVVKVSWDVVAKAGEPTKTPEVLRAKERLVRLSRGEDPATIP